MSDTTPNKIPDTTPNTTPDTTSNTTSNTGPDTVEGTPQNDQKLDQNTAVAQQNGMEVTKKNRHTGLVIGIIVIAIIIILILIGIGYLLYWYLFIHNPMWNTDLDNDPSFSGPSTAEYQAAFQ